MFLTNTGPPWSTPVCLNADANATIIDSKSRAGGYLQVRPSAFFQIKRFLITPLINVRALLIQNLVHSSFNVFLTPFCKTLEWLNVTNSFEKLHFGK